MAKIKLGEALSPVLTEIERTLIAYESECNQPPLFPDDALRSATKIFMAVLMDRMWALQVSENMEPRIRAEMARRAGSKIRKFVNTYTGVDTHQFYK